jgi:hypothetical protein
VVQDVLEAVMTKHLGRHRPYECGEGGAGSLQGL